MRKFREEYTKTIERLPCFAVEVEALSEEKHHRRMQAAARRRAMSMAAAAAGFLLLCSVGTVTAVHLHSSHIEVRDNGFVFSGTYSMEEAAAAHEEMASFKAYDGDPEAMPAPEAIEGVVEELPAERVYHTVEEFRASEDIIIAIPELALLDKNEPDYLEIAVEEQMSRVRVHIAYGEKVFYMAQSGSSRV